MFLKEENLKKFTFILTIFIAITIVSDVFSQCNHEDCTSYNTLVLKINNDAVKRRKDPSSDKRYTHGTTLGIITNNIKDKLENIPVINQLGDSIYNSFQLNQDIYTPDEIENETPNPNEHPYSGELSLILGLHGKKNIQFCCHETPTLFSIEIALGVTGKYSLAKNAQTEVHRCVGDTIPLGWDHQLPSHFSARLSTSMINKFNPVTIGDFKIEVLSNIGADLGNTLVQASVCEQLRFGFNIPDDFGTFAIGSGSFASNLQGKNSSIHRSRSEKFWEYFGLHFILSAKGQYVSYNYHLGEIVAPVREIGELGIGLGFIVCGCKVTVFYIHQTEQFEEQSSPHKFGNIAFTHAW
jgi:hypothetical protein